MKYSFHQTLKCLRHYIFKYFFYPLFISPFMVDHFILSHRSVNLFSFILFSLFFPLCGSPCIKLIAMFAGLLIFSSIMPNLLLIPFSEILILESIFFISSIFISSIFSSHLVLFYIFHFYSDSFNVFH